MDESDGRSVSSPCIIGRRRTHVDISGYAHWLLWFAGYRVATRLPHHPQPTIPPHPVHRPSDACTHASTHLREDAPDDKVLQRGDHAVQRLIHCVRHRSRWIDRWVPLLRSVLMAGRWAGASGAWISDLMDGYPPPQSKAAYGWSIVAGGSMSKINKIREPLLVKNTAILIERGVAVSIAIARRQQPHQTSIGRRCLGRRLRI